MKYFIKKNILAALSLGCIFLLGSCDDKNSDAPDTSHLKVEVSTDIESYLSQNGKIKAKLTAPKMIRALVDSPYTEFPHSLYVEFFDDSAQIESTLTAQYAKYREYENRIYLRDSIVIINVITQDTLRTSELWWDQEEQLFYTDKPARITKRDGTVANPTKGLKAKQDLSWYEFYANRDGRLPIPPDEEQEMSAPEPEQ